MDLNKRDVESLRVVLINRDDIIVDGRRHDYCEELLLNTVYWLVFGGLLIMIDIVIFNMYFPKN